MIWLGTAAQGRDNNLNLIRMVAATAVLSAVLSWHLVERPALSLLHRAKRRAGQTVRP